MMTPNIPEFNVSWELKAPPLLVPGQNQDWIRDLSRFRGSVLFENGRRPFFKTADQLYADPDDLDLFSYHILAKQQGQLVGCIRLLPLSPASPFNCVIGQEIDHNEFTQILKEIKLINKENQIISEASRWIVDLKLKQTLIGAQLLYGVWALSLELNTLFIANGGQNAYKLVSRFGAIPVPNSKVYFSKKYNDDLNIFYFDKSKLSPRIRQSIEKMRAILNLSVHIPRIKTTIL